jgi:hypothetical protein
VQRYRVGGRLHVGQQPPAQRCQNSTSREERRREGDPATSMEHVPAILVAVDVDQAQDESKAEQA